MIFPSWYYEDLSHLLHSSTMNATATTNSKYGNTDDNDTLLRRIAKMSSEQLSFRLEELFQADLSFNSSERRNMYIEMGMIMNKLRDWEFVPQKVKFIFSKYKKMLFHSFNFFVLEKNWNDFWVICLVSSLLSGIYPISFSIQNHGFQQQHYRNSFGLPSAGLP